VAGARQLPEMLKQQYKNGPLLKARTPFLPMEKGFQEKVHPMSWGCSSTLKGHLGHENDGLGLENHKSCGDNIK
jgi:hypothetical protein